MGLPLKISKLVLGKWKKLNVCEKNWQSHKNDREVIL